MRILLGLLLTATALSASAQTLVVRSAGPSAARLAPGSILAAPLRLQLLAGDHVTLLDHGATYEATGPALVTELRLTRADAATLTTLRAIAAQGGRARNRVAATRSAPGGIGAPVAPPAHDSLWQIELGESGAWCLPEGAPVRLLRQPGASAASLEWGSDTDRTVLDWPAATATLTLPASERITDGARYEARIGMGQPTAVTLRRIPPPADLVDAARAMAAAGCLVQLDRIAGMLGGEE